MTMYRSSAKRFNMTRALAKALGVLLIVGFLSLWLQGSDPSEPFGPHSGLIVAVWAALAVGVLLTLSLRKEAKEYPHWRKSKVLVGLAFLYTLISVIGVTWTLVIGAQADAERRCLGPNVPASCYQK